MSAATRMVPAYVRRNASMDAGHFADLTLEAVYTRASAAVRRSLGTGPKEAAVGDLRRCGTSSWTHEVVSAVDDWADGRG